jgi:K+-transporting ATPase ATPase C chain
VPRVARARNIDAGQIRELIRAHTEGPALGVFGRDRVNVLELNLALDAKFGGSR